jgi:gliding motility-associated-like protein
MKKFFLLITMLCALQIVNANHIIGGEMRYSYLGPSPQGGANRYEVVLKIYRGNQGAMLDANIVFTIFNTNSGTLFGNPLPASLEGPFITSWMSTNPCIVNAPLVYYEVGFYRTIVDLPETSSGYTIGYQRCCRDASIANLVSPDEQGATYYTTIPGTGRKLDAPINSSARFNDNDSVVVCQNSFFEIDYRATDADGDALVYRFGPAYQGGGRAQGSGCGAIVPNPSCYPFEPCNYLLPNYSPISPMGAGVTINPNTGLVSGIAPAEGEYIVTVYADEYRNGILINEHHKEFLVNVSNCSVADAKLDPEYVSCNGFDFTFVNKAGSTNINFYEWSFGDGTISNQESPTHTYTDTGVYNIKLVVNRGMPCADSTTATLKVYPGFFPAWDFLGQCKNTSIQFTDRTTSTYGFPNSWKWTFSDPSSGPNDSSRLKNPTHIFNTSGTYKVTLLVKSNLGCSDTTSKFINIKDLPAYLLQPKDTLICPQDTLALNVIGIGTVTWSPNYNLSDTIGNSILASPDTSTTYRVIFNDGFGCIATDSVKVKVVNSVIQNLPPQLTVCTGDTLKLPLTSNALKYNWQPNIANLITNTDKTPIFIADTTRTFTVRGTISAKCFADNQINIKVVNAPTVIAPNQNVCIGSNKQLFASGGSNYTWSPAIYLNATNINNPIAINPTSSLNYTVTVTDTLGCPKAISAVVRLNVIKIIANAGPADTSVVLGQPLQLNATGGQIYNWINDTRWLTATNINNPIANVQDNITYTVVVSDTNNCQAQDAIRVRFFRVSQGLYVPNSFTPNADGLNDIFKPIPLGITTIIRFSVFNRFGQLVFTTTQTNQGWDGTFKGKPQDPGNFVWYAEATDFLGNNIKKKGNVILIR